MARSDYTWVNFDHTFTAAAPSATRTFVVGGNPLGGLDLGPNEGYLLVQLLDVEQGASQSDHQIEINGTALPSFDIPTGFNNRWQLWMDRIPANLLNSGANTITIRRVGADDFFVANVVIHWRETEPAPGLVAAEDFTAVPS